MRLWALLLGLLLARKPVSYTDFLADGRKLMDKGDYAAAIRDFERCLALKPDDPVASHELAYALIQTKDWDRAEKVLATVVDHPFTPGQRASALYRLGRIAERRGDKDKAVDLYKRSLLQEPDAVVRAHLASVDAEAEADVDPLTPKPLAGPYPSIAAWCRARLDGGEPCDVCGRPVKRQAGDGNVRSLGLYASRCGTSGESEDLDLVVETADGFFAGQAGNVRGGQCTWDEVSVRDLSVRDGRITTRWSAHFVCESEADAREHNETWMVVAGVGPSGKPSRTPAIRVDGRCTARLAGEKRPLLGEVGLALRFGQGGPDGLELDVAGGANGLYRTDNGFLGRHRLVFP